MLMDAAGIGNCATSLQRKWPFCDTSPRDLATAAAELDARQKVFGAALASFLLLPAS